MDRSSGFTLLEVAIVLMIVGLLLGSVIQPLGSRIIERQRKQTVDQLVSIREAIIGFASVNHRLPCPLTNAAIPSGDCGVEHGYVPAAVLGLSGHYNADGLIVDSWGAPILYHVSMSDADNDGQADFTSSQEMRDVSMQQLTPDFEVCDSTACNQLRANDLPAVLVSTGAKNHSSSDELENLDGDKRFVNRDLDQSGNDQFDDIVLWLSGNILYTRLLQARVLP